jgi:hypothetical protein
MSYLRVNIIYNKINYTHLINYLNAKYIDSLHYSKITI